MAQIDMIIQQRYNNFNNLISEAELPNYIPLAGEVCWAQVNVGPNGEKAILSKIGDGTHTFEELPWTNGLAADVFPWAKQSAAEFQNWAKTNLPYYTKSEVDSLIPQGGTSISLTIWEAED